MAPEVGLEPTTDRLTADCSTIELLWNSASLSERRCAQVSPEISKALPASSMVFEKKCKKVFKAFFGASGCFIFLLQYGPCIQFFQSSKIV